jgi:hypothetical protein
MTRTNVYHHDEYDGDTLAGWFDQDRATAYDGACEWDGSNSADINVGANRWQTLYRTAQGRWVIENRSAWEKEPTTYRFAEPTDAREWLLKNGYDKAVIRHFGPVEEERGPGRPEVGPAVHTRLPQDLVDSIDAMAKDSGVSRAEMIRDLLTAGLKAVAR